ncbi:MAG: acetyl-CoA carboxylase biotin carboxyl carrier protein [Ruminococcus sp.]|nr:acetyl-CoA carboxylase biotin carboxyl carrier protein [Ruminococcus sp.]MCR5141987.1 acetyl-CoA carboxylase biotin carboxyl carrier protein [Ruminococcus sp.]
MSKILNMIEFEDIEKLAALVKENDLEEISLEVKDGQSITIKGKKCPPPVQGAPMLPAGMPMVSPAVNQTMTAPIDTPVPETIKGTAVKAPIVGTFYSKPRPDASPFVTVGSKVKKGDILYILETMKVMNEISAECDGVVSKILAADGDALEYGQTVMIIG